MQVGLQAHTFGSCAWSQPGQGLFRQLRQFHRQDLRTPRTRLQPGQVQHLPHQRAHSVALIQDNIQILRPLFRGDVLPQGLRMGAEHGQRGLQLMGGRPGEVPLAGQLRLPSGLVGMERRRQGVQLPDGAVFRTGRSFGHPGAQLLHRLGHLPGQARGQNQQDDQCQQTRAEVQPRLLLQRGGQHVALNGQILQHRVAAHCAPQGKPPVLPNGALRPGDLPVQDGLGLPEGGQPRFHIDGAVLPIAAPGRQQHAAHLQVGEVPGFARPLQGGLHHGVRRAVGMDDLNLLHGDGVARPFQPGDPGKGAVPAPGALPVVRRVDAVLPPRPVGQDPAGQLQLAPVVQPLVQGDVPPLADVHALPVAPAPGQLAADISRLRPGRQGHPSVHFADLPQREGAEVVPQDVRRLVPQSVGEVVLIEFAVLLQTRLGGTGRGFGAALQLPAGIVRQQGHGAQPKQGKRPAQGPQQLPAQPPGPRAPKTPHPSHASSS